MFCKFLINLLTYLSLSVFASSHFSLTVQVQAAFQNWKDNCNRLISLRNSTMINSCNY